jgi:SAM-dependent methyltransferase
MSWGYGVLATEVYDLDKPVGTSFGDVEYYEQFLRNGEGPILEPAVGTGRILVPLAQAGLAVDGYDSSPEMLSVCRERCAERGIDPTILEADMTTFVAPEEYSSVILPTGSITLLHGPDELRAALGCFWQALKPGGRLRSWRAEPYIWTLQTLHVDFDAAANQTTRWLRYDNGATAPFSPPNFSPSACSTGASRSSRRTYTRADSPMSTSPLTMTPTALPQHRTICGPSTRHVSERRTSANSGRDGDRPRGSGRQKAIAACRSHSPNHEAGVLSRHYR